MRRKRWPACTVFARLHDQISITLFTNNSIEILPNKGMSYLSVLHFSVTSFLMQRNESLHRACFLSTCPGSHTIPSRLRLTSVVFLASIGILVSSYLPVWPSKYWGSPTFTHQPMSPNYFVPATVSDISQTRPDLAMLTLTLPRNAYG